MLSAANKPFAYLRDIVHDELKQFTVLAAEADFAMLESCSNSQDDNFDSKKSKILAWLGYWKGNSMYCRAPVNLLDEKTGLPCESGPRCAEVLKDAWSRKFEDMAVNEEVMDFFTEHFSVDLSKIDFATKFDDFVERIKKAQVVLPWTRRGALLFLGYARNGREAFVGRVASLEGRYGTPTGLQLRSSRFHLKIARKSTRR